MSATQRNETRTDLSLEQHAILEEEFRKDPFIQKEKRIELATRLDLSENTIEMWFENRRKKLKREQSTPSPPLAAVPKSPGLSPPVPHAAATSLSPHCSPPSPTSIPQHRYRPHHNFPPFNIVPEASTSTHENLEEGPAQSTTPEADISTHKKTVFLSPSKMSATPRNKSRTHLTPEQYEILEEEFRKDPFIKKEKKTELATRLDVSENTIKMWFENQRKKLKREQSTPSPPPAAVAKSPGLSPPVPHAAATSLSPHCSPPSPKSIPQYRYQPRGNFPLLNLVPKASTSTHENLEEGPAQSIMSQTVSLSPSKASATHRNMIKIHLSREQYATLEEEFRKEPFPVKEKRTELATRLNLSELTIKRWFQNRRKKERRGQSTPSPPTASVAKSPLRAAPVPHAAATSLPPHYSPPSPTSIPQHRYRPHHNFPPFNLVPEASTSTHENLEEEPAQSTTPEADISTHQPGCSKPPKPTP